MQVVYTGENMPQSFSKSLFLAGPSLRPGQEKEMTSWRQDALKVLEDIGFNGVVFCPENRGFDFPEGFDYDQQIEWEEKCLNVADVIVFWVPRSIEKELFAFTTNLEWGHWADSGKVVLGFPESADKMEYMHHYADKYKVPVSDTLTATLKHAIDKLGEGAERQGGERFVPLFIWQTDSFQQWYQAQTKAGNVLEQAKLLFNFRPRFKDFVFLWVLHAKMYISSEDRYKENEFVLSRTDISSVLLWKQAETLLDSEIVVVKEYRVPASNSTGFIYELPGGSSPKKGSVAEDTAAEETHEELGLYLDPSRFRLIKARQLAGTLSAHQAHLYVVKLEAEELEWLRSQKDIAHGKEEDTERTFIEIWTIKQLLESDWCDWTTVGMVMEAYTQDSTS